MNCSSSGREADTKHKVLSVLMATQVLALMEYATQLCNACHIHETTGFQDSSRWLPDTH